MDMNVVRRWDVNRQENIEYVEMTLRLSVNKYLDWKKMSRDTSSLFTEVGKGKVNESLYKRGWSSQISRYLAHGCGKVASLMHRPHLPLRKYFLSSFVLDVDCVNEKFQWYIRELNPQPSDF
jgi:hypothetical protein